jgi:colanic acid/amylovoran biosynthesis glycosyltransferase
LSLVEKRFKIRVSNPMSSFRLLIAGLSWPPETFIERLARGLLAAGVQLTLTSPIRPGHEWFALPGFSWLPTPPWEGNLVVRSGRLARQFAWGLWYGRENLQPFAAHARTLSGIKERLAFWHQFLPFAGRRWDVVYFPWNSAAISHLPLFDMGMPVVVSCRGSQVNVAPHDPRREAIREGLRATFERAAAVHCVSEAVRQEARQYGLSLERSSVIYPAVDPEFFHSGGRKTDDTFRIVSAGNLQWVKGYEYALQAIRLLKDQGVRVEFTVIGDGPERQRLLYTLHDLHLEGVVRLLGRLDPEKVREQLQQADVFLLSSLSEGLSNAVLEAMACGLPVVTTDAGGMREAVTNGVEGFVVPVRDAVAMAGALIQMWEQPALRKQFAHAARRRVCTMFSLEQQVGRFVGLFEGVV